VKGDAKAMNHSIAWGERRQKGDRQNEKATRWRT